jgi:TonB family protein
VIDSREVKWSDVQASDVRTQIAKKPSVVQRQPVTVRASTKPSPAKPKPAAKGRQPAPPPRKPAGGRPPSPPAVAPQAASANGTIDSASPVAPPPSVVRVVKAPAAAAGAAPSTPFFQPTDVSQTPRVATRVEPQLPDDLRSGKVNEVVVVRALISQGGQPSRVSLLRRSKSGPKLDDAVVAAVNRWTFSPAVKQGEAVSCWLNFAVVLGDPD